jgi:hypothetical protein
MLQVIAAAMKSTSSLQVISAGASGHHQGQQRWSPPSLASIAHMAAAMKTTTIITSIRQVLGCADKPTHQKKFARLSTKVRERRKVMRR